jgi:hypothetical protein
MKAYVFVPLGVPGATSGSMFTPVPVEVRTAHGPGQGFGSGLDPDSVRSVDPDPYPEDEGVYVFVPLGVPGATSGSMFTPVPVERRGKTAPRVSRDPDPDWIRIQSGQWIRIRIRKMKAYVFVPLGVPGATSGSMFTPVPVEVRLRPGFWGIRIRIGSGFNQVSGSGSVFGR